jgi:flagellar FliL protein
MADGKKAGGEVVASDAAPQKRNMRKLALFAAVPILLAAAGATYFLFPALTGTAAHAAAQAADKAPGKAQDKGNASTQAAQPHPTIIDVPEILVTLPNGGRARQLRIKISLELTQAAHDLPPAEQLTPQINDALLTYLRTLRDGDLEGGLALDRIRGDIYRRLTLVLGDNVVQEVLITSLVTG